jgi:hypothetical protein
MFIRHLDTVPIACRLQQQQMADTPTCSCQIPQDEVSGLRFQSKEILPPGGCIEVTIELPRHAFKAEGTVVWCTPDAGGYDVAVRFDDQQTRFALRMVEQACRIERYRDQTQERQGRDLDSNQAAAEWIELFAADFARP